MIQNLKIITSVFPQVINVTLKQWKFDGHFIKDHALEVSQQIKRMHSTSSTNQVFPEKIHGENLLHFLSIIHALEGKPTKKGCKRIDQLFKFSQKKIQNPKLPRHVKDKKIAEEVNYLDLLREKTNCRLQITCFCM